MTHKLMLEKCLRDFMSPGMQGSTDKNYRNMSEVAI